MTDSTIRWARELGAEFVFTGQKVACISPPKAASRNDNGQVIAESEVEAARLWIEAYFLTREAQRVPSDEPWRDIKAGDQVVVAAPAYHGPGIAEARAVIPVRLCNGNTWWYPVDTVRPGIGTISEPPGICGICHENPKGPGHGQMCQTCEDSGGLIGWGKRSHEVAL